MESGDTTLAECRICQEEDTKGNLEIPCACSGTLKYVHRKCLEHWSLKKGDSICELCYQQYKPKAVDQMPEKRSAHPDGADASAQQGSSLRRRHSSSGFAANPRSGSRQRIHEQRHPTTTHALAREPSGSHSGSLSLDDIDDEVIDGVGGEAPHKEEASTDPNVEILREISKLNDISAVLKSGDRLRRSLASTVDAIIDTIIRSNGALYDITSYRERKRHEYADGLDYNAVKMLKITKEQIFALFREPQTGQIPNRNRAHISIEWCTYPPFQHNWVDRWYMVFDVPPHNNREIPLYFLRKMYAEFVLGKLVNYFDILEFEGVGLGMPQNRPNAKLRDSNRPVPQPRRLLPRQDVTPAHQLILDTQEALLSLTQAVVRHSTFVERMDQAGPSFACGVQPASSEGKLTYHEANIEPHECTMCGRLCYGLVTDVNLTGFLSQLPDASSQGQGVATSDPPPCGEGYVLESTGGFDVPDVVVSSMTIGHTELLDPPQGQNIASSDPHPSGETYVPQPTGHFDVAVVAQSSAATSHKEASTKISRPSLAVASPHRPNIDKGHVYVRRSTPSKSVGGHNHGATDCMHPVGESYMPDLTRIIGASFSATFTMGTSQTKPLATAMPGPSSSIVVATELDVQPMALPATQGTQSPFPESLFESTTAERSLVRTPHASIPRMDLTPEMHFDPRHRHDRLKSRKNKRKIDF